MLLELQHYGFKPNKETNSVANISFVMYNVVFIKIYRRIYGALTLNFLEGFLRVFSHVNNPRQSSTSKDKTRHLTPYNRLYIRKSTKRADIRRNFYSESVSCRRGKVFKRLHQISQICSTLIMKKKIKHNYQHRFHITRVTGVKMWFLVWPEHKRNTYWVEAPWAANRVWKRL